MARMAECKSPAPDSRPDSQEIKERSEGSCREGLIEKKSPCLSWLQYHQRPLPRKSRDRLGRDPMQKVMSCVLQT